MRDFANLTFLPLDLNFDDYCHNIERETMSHFEKLGFWSTYQDCWMLPLWTSGGGIKEIELFEKLKPYTWTKAAESMPATRAMIENVIFPWARGFYRVVALVTPPGHPIKLHADCTIADLDSLNHKLRYSITGDISSLWFLDRDLKKVYVSDVSRSYVLDGSHPHGVDARSGSFKITICVGSPWSGDLEGKFLSLMQASETKYRSQILWREDLGRPFLRDIFIDKLREAEAKGLEDPRDQILRLIQ